MKPALTEAEIFPQELVAAAAESQATLTPKLAELAAVQLSFPGGPGLTAAERWIETGGPSPDGLRLDPAWSSDRGEVAPAATPAAKPTTVTTARDATLPSATVAELLAGYRSGELNPVEVLEDALTRMDAADGGLHAVVTRLDDRARAAAAESARRWRSGGARPLEGVPVGVKDIIETAGVPTRAGSALFADHVPSASATVIDRLERAGAVVAAKTATPELAFGDESGDGVVNPRGAGRWAGGSSSGSAAALAAGLLPAALGTDTGGSIRVPASYCGVCGLKPTFGRVPRTGVFPVSWTLDHVGPMARTVDDLALLLTIMAGADPDDPYSSPQPVPDYPAAAAAAAEDLTGLRVGMPGGWLAEGCSPGVIAARNAAADALTALGAEVTEVKVPHAELAGTVAWLITVVEFAANHDPRLKRAADFTPSAAYRLVAGARASAGDYARALRARRLVQRDFDAVFKQVDAVLTPATPTAAPDMSSFFDDGDRLWLDKVARTLLIFNVTGMPALVVPVGDDDGLPAAVQIAARPHSDALCLAVGAALQRAAEPELGMG